VHARKTAAFEELFLPHIDGAYNLARWIVERDRDAQTVVQEAYIQALNEFVEFRGADVRAWLLVIVRNAAYTWIQKRGINSGIIPFEEAIHVAPTDQPLSESSHEEQNRQLNEALTRLPVKFREILVLREIEGWSYKQLASALTVPPATVVSRLIRARRRLRQEVA
jgi:RNA polymerase sigma-70 factor (ECF subfamily)